MVARISQQFLPISAFCRGGGGRSRGTCGAAGDGSDDDDDVSCLCLLMLAACLTAFVSLLLV